jgi:hypothetical protein
MTEHGAMEVSWRLRRIFEYGNGLASLIRATKTLGGIQHEWIISPPPLCGPLISANTWERTHRELAYGVALAEYPDVLKRYPRLDMDWQESYRPVLHSVLASIVFFHKQQYYPEDDTHYIGCSTPTCLCCKKWIEIYNYINGTQWQTPKSNDKIFVDWAQPDPYTGVIASVLEYYASSFFARRSADAWLRDGCQMKMYGHA